MGIFGKLRPLVERSPVLAAGYRAMRTELRHQRYAPISMRHGFRLVGDLPINDGVYEPAETELLLAALREADVFVDIGANIGYFTCLAGASGVRTVAIEPLDENLRLLYANLTLNGLRDRVEVFPIGVAHEPGVRTLFGAATGASLIEGWAAPSPILQRHISVSTLDILLASRFRGERILVKVDVEGAEYEVLRGASELLSRDPQPRWVIEICFSEHHPGGCNPNFQATFELMWSHGYSARGVGGGPVTPAQIARIMANGRRDSDVVTYVFEALDAAPQSA